MKSTARVNELNSIALTEGQKSAIIVSGLVVGSAAGVGYVMDRWKGLAIGSVVGIILLCLIPAPEHW